MSKLTKDGQSCRQYMAELVGTMLLVLLGCGSAVLAGSQIGFLGIALTFGLTLLMLVYALGALSGCHVNPAVTFGMIVAGRMDTKDGVMYIIMQCVGAVIGAAILYLIASGKAGYDLASNGLGQNGYDAGSPSGYGAQTAFLAEVVLTAVFVFIVLGATASTATAGFAGLAIGIALAVVHLVGIPITGGSFNPARSFGPALLVGGEALSQLWLFWVAPLLGGAVGAIIWNTVSCEK